jgi:hypothetical protein
MYGLVRASVRVYIIVSPSHNVIATTTPLLAILLLMRNTEARSKHTAYTRNVYRAVSAPSPSM